MEHELPSPVTQYPIVCEGRHYRTDFAWPELRVILEFDGEQKYVDYPGRDRQEAARDRALTRAGWTVIHLTWADIFQKEREVVAHLRRLLRRCARSPLNGSRFRFVGGLVAYGVGLNHPKSD